MAGDHCVQALDEDRGFCDTFASGGKKYIRCQRLTNLLFSVLMDHGNTTK